MQFLRKHSALLTLGGIIAVSFYSLGWHAGETQIPTEVGGGVENITDGQPVSVDFSDFWRVWNTIEDKFVPASSTAESVSKQEMVWGAIDGLARSLGDPYTTFFTPVENELFESDIRGNFEGVGMEILSQEGVVLVISPLKGSPAERAGILAGDRIVKIDGKETHSLTTDKAVEIIRGPRGTKVTFTIFRNGQKEAFDISVTRDTINIPTIATEDLGNGVFKIELYSFSAQSPNLFRNALREFITSGNRRLILDLRGNPGGYLEAAIDMASWFLPSGKVVVRESFGEGREEKVYRSKGYDIFGDNLKFVILLNKGSASASEILAGALSEHGEAVLVGEQTFGKGSVQELVPISSDTSFKVTIARWLTPNGVSISDTGIIPEHMVKETPEDREKGRDPQLDAAIKILLTD